MSPVAGGLAIDPNCLRWLGNPPPDPRNVPPIANFWLWACLKKNLLHVTAGIHLYQLLTLNMPRTFGEEDVLIHKRCIIRPKVFHPVVLTQKNYLKNPSIWTNPTLALAAMRFFLPKHCRLRSSNKFFRAKQRNLIFVQNCRVKNTVLSLEIFGCHLP